MGPKPAAGERWSKQSSSCSRLSNLLRFAENGIRAVTLTYLSYQDVGGPSPRCCQRRRVLGPKVLGCSGGGGFQPSHTSTPQLDKLASTLPCPGETGEAGGEERAGFVLSLPVPREEGGLGRFGESLSKRPRRGEAAAMARGNANLRQALMWRSAASEAPGSEFSGP